MHLKYPFIAPKVTVFEMVNFILLCASKLSIADGLVTRSKLKRDALEEGLKS